MNIVMQCSHDYEDAWASPILATPDRIKAEAKVKEMTDRQAVRNAAMEAFMLHMQRWRDANPRPVYKKPKLKPLPNYGPKRGKWSKEQLDEYNSVKDYNRQEQVKSSQPSHDWAMANLQENQRFEATFPQQVQEDIRGMDESTFWKIEEVPYDVQERTVTDYIGDSDVIRFIKCPKCQHENYIRRQ